MSVEARAQKKNSLLNVGGDGRCEKEREREKWVSGEFQLQRWQEEKK